MHRTARLGIPRASLALMAAALPFAANAAVHDSPNPASSAETPFTGTPVSIPGEFEAENFNRGGQDVAYHDNSSGNAGGAHRPVEDVDIRATGDTDSQYVVFNFETGEWLDYTVDVSQEGQYSVDLRISTKVDNAAFHIELDGIDVSGRVVVPNTGSWQRYQWAGVPRVRLPAGSHVLRVVSEQQYFNFDAVRVTAETASLSATGPTTTEPREPDRRTAGLRTPPRLIR